MRLTVLLALAAVAAFGQSENASKFEIADVHVSAKSANSFYRARPPRNGRYEIKNATMLELISLAYGFKADTVVGGPNWLELDQFDVIAKMPVAAEAGAEKALLQALLEDRFKLAVRKDTKPVPVWVLSAGKPKLKEADGSGETGCKVDGSGAPEEGGIRLMRMNQDGTTTTINLGPGGTIRFKCRNMTMPAFAERLLTMEGARLGAEPVVDETGLQGKWNFEVSWSMGLPLPGAEQISVMDAIDRQLGLKLEQRPVAKPVLVVENVNRTPTPNSPDLAKVLPPIDPPTEFEVAEVKLAPPASGLPMFGFPRMQPGGRFTCENCPMRILISQAFNGRGGNDQLVGVPSWADSARVSITAKMPAEADTGPGLDSETMAPLLRNLLKARFKLAYHEEERQLTAYSLVSVKPKMKKADPESRIYCRRAMPSPGAPPGSQTLTCQNATMALFAERLLQMYPGLNWPVVDESGIEGSWDFTLTFSILPMGMLNGAGRGGDAGPGGVAAAPDPSGGGPTIFEAIEKQLGLKLKTEKRPEKVIVIDHLEQKPTDN